MKQTYEKSEYVIITLAEEDIITTSNPSQDKNEAPIKPFQG